MRNLNYAAVGVVLVLCLLALPVYAQETEPITAENITRLQSVVQIELAAGLYNTGSFAMSPDGHRLLVRDSAQTIYLLTDMGELLHTIQPLGDFRDAAFSETQVAVIFSDDSSIYVETYTFDTGEIQNVVIKRNDLPAAAWFTGETLWLELLPYLSDHAPVIYRVPLAPALEELETPYTLAADTDAIVRIVRVPPPFAVTSSAKGNIKLWNLETGEIVHEVDTELPQAATLGNTNRTGTHLAWSDGLSTTLYLLDFTTGENRVIDKLNAEYAQWFFLSNDASVIIAVNLDFDTVVIAWDTQTGEKHVLGEYQTCERPQPDMSRLSVDGTTLVIACNTGLDIWRIPND